MPGPQTTETVQNQQAAPCRALLPPRGLVQGDASLCGCKAGARGGRPLTVEVIGAGFGRTGTMSLKVALEELGFGPCYHMSELFEYPEYVERWEAAVRGEPVDWGELFY